MIFVDTSAWFASIVPSDVDHSAASRWLSQNKEPLGTTDYVVDETLTLLSVRGQRLRALEFGEQLFRGRLASIFYLTETDLLLTWRIFCQYSDKNWSFTDCTSKVVMDKLGLTQAFAFDHHFREFGKIEVVP